MSPETIAAVLMVLGYAAFIGLLLILSDQGIAMWDRYTKEDE